MAGKMEADIPKWNFESGFTESIIAKIKEAANNGGSLLETVFKPSGGESRNVSITLKRIPANGSFVVFGHVTDSSVLNDLKGDLHYRDKWLDVLNRVAVILLSRESENIDDLRQEAMGIMGRRMDIDRIYIWVNRVIGGTLHYVSAFEWLKSAAYKNEALTSDEGFSYVESIPEWEDKFRGKGYVNGAVSSLSPNERRRLAPYGIKSILVIPIFLRDKFWGFVSFDDCHREREFTDDEVNVLRSGSLMIAAALSRGQMERERADALAQAVRASKAKSDFLSNMSHEIRTPMNAIIGMTSIGKAASDTEKKDYAFGRIENASKHLLGVINDVLDMSKIEADKLELSDVSFDFEKMLQSVVNVVNFRVDERKQTFYVTIDRRIPSVLIGDDQRLAQVITNLLANAVKFTPERGTIKLNAHLSEFEDGECLILIEVIDSGIGVSEEQQSRLFGSFEQAESGTSRKFGGTGLGLAISKRIVEMMGGKIWIESELGSGAKFAFTVRMRAGDRPCAPVLDGAVDWGNVRVLAANAEPEIMECFRDITPIYGLRCDLAASDDEVEGKTRENGPYDIYFIDWQSHGVNGAEAVRRIRNLDAEHMIVAMLSATDRVTAEDEAKEAGVGKFLIKPIFPSAIAEMINECIARKDAPEENSEEAAENFEGHRIMLVEDVEVNREIVLALLEPTKLEIDCAENGAVAIRMFADAPERYEMIFMDVQMPELDGYEATELIREMEIPEGKTIPIVAMTANVFREDIDKCLEAGMDDHVGKPLDLGEVIEKLRKYLPRDEEIPGGKNIVKYGAANSDGELGWSHGVAWNPNLATGHEKIDTQHKQLFKLTSDLVEACEKGSDIMTVGRTLDFLASYTVSHFADEEKLMEIHHYPGYSEHKKKHDDFKQTVTGLIESYKSTGITSDLSNAVNTVVIRWLTTHISQVDRKLADYIRVCESEG
jgi:hemerythrin-like metal-binding protein